MMKKKILIVEDEFIIALRVKQGLEDKGYDIYGPVAEGKETREFNGKNYVLEESITGEFAIVRAWKADRYGNCVYRDTAMNFNPMAATAGKITVVEAEEIVEPGELNPTEIHTPGIYVNRVIKGSFEKRIERLTLRK